MLTQPRLSSIYSLELHDLHHKATLLNFKRDANTFSIADVFTLEQKMTSVFEKIS
ncbi:hypothetical protein ACU8KH_05501 [Lachancea thermotolerans]